MLTQIGIYNLFYGSIIVIWIENNQGENYHGVQSKYIREFVARYSILVGVVTRVTVK